MKTIKLRDKEFLALSIIEGNIYVFFYEAHGLKHCHVEDNFTLSVREVRLIKQSEQYAALQKMMHISETFTELDRGDLYKIKLAVTQAVKSYKKVKMFTVSKRYERVLNKVKIILKKL